MCTYTHTHTHTRIQTDYSRSHVRIFQLKMV